MRRFASAAAPTNSTQRRSPASKTVTEYLSAAPKPLADLFTELETFVESLGDDVTKKTLKNYVAYRRLKNFACLEVHSQSHTLLVYLEVDPTTVSLEEAFSRDVRKIGHYLELRVRDAFDLAKAEPLIQRNYTAN